MSHRTVAWTVSHGGVQAGGRHEPSQKYTAPSTGARVPCLPDDSRLAPRRVLALADPAAGDPPLRSQRVSTSEPQSSRPLRIPSRPNRRVGGGRGRHGLVSDSIAETTLRAGIHRHPDLAPARRGEGAIRKAQAGTRCRGEPCMDPSTPQAGTSGKLTYVNWRPSARFAGSLLGSSNQVKYRSVPSMRWSRRASCDPRGRRR